MVAGAEVVLALKCRGRVVSLEERRPPQQGNTLATGGRLAGFFLKGFCTARGCRHALGVLSGRRESRVHAAQAGCSTVESSNGPFLSETEKLRLLNEICSRGHDEKNMSQNGTDYPFKKKESMHEAIS